MSAADAESLRRVVGGVVAGLGAAPLPLHPFMLDHLLNTLCFSGGTDMSWAAAAVTPTLLTALSVQPYPPTSTDAPEEDGGLSAVTPAGPGAPGRTSHPSTADLRLQLARATAAGRCLTLLAPYVSNPHRVEAAAERACSASSLGCAGPGGLVLPGATAASETAELQRVVRRLVGALTEREVRARHGPGFPRPVWNLNAVLVFAWDDDASPCRPS
jgi:hypothetical protein